MSIFEHELHDKIRALKDEVVKGTSTHEEYKKLCGRIQGLTEALEIFKDLVKKQLRNEDFE